MGFRTLEDQRRAVEAAAVENAKRETVAEVYARFPLLIRCMANDQLIIEIVTRFAGPDAMPSGDLFLTALDENPEEMKNLAQQPEAKTRQQLTEEILSLLAANGSHHDAFTLKAEDNRLKHFSIEALRARLADIKTKQRMASTPLPLLKAFVSDAHKDQSVNGYPVLPTALWDGKHVKVDADYLNHLVKTDMWQFKKLVRLYGSSQIDRARGIK